MNPPTSANHALFMAAAPGVIEQPSAVEAPLMASRSGGEFASSTSQPVTTAVGGGDQTGQTSPALASGKRPSVEGEGNIASARQKFAPADRLASELEPSAKTQSADNSFNDLSLSQPNSERTMAFVRPEQRGSAPPDLARKNAPLMPPGADPVSTLPGSEKLIPNSEAAVAMPVGGARHWPVPSGDPLPVTGNGRELSPVSVASSNALPVPSGQWPASPGGLPGPTVPTSEFDLKTTSTTREGESNLSLPPTISTSERGISVAGMFAAQSDGMMKTAANRDDLSQRDEQKLPPGENSAAKLEAIGRAKTKARATIGTADLLADAVTGTQTNWPAFSVDNQFARWSSVTEIPVNALRPVNFDPLVAQISRQAVALRHFNAESMAVVLKPDDATAVFLHLKLTAGVVEVQARFERGDYAALNAGWGQVQQALAAQGIRLGPLQAPVTHHSTSTVASSFAGLTQEQDQKQSSEDYFPDAPPGRPLPIPGPKAARRRAASSTVRAHENWESWA